MVDLALRTGSPDRFSPCPYEGYAGFFLKNSNGVSNMIELLDNELDFNSLKSPVTYNGGEPLPMEDEQCKKAAYYLLEMRMEGVRKNNKGGFKAEQYRFKDATVTQDDDGDLEVATDRITTRAEINVREYKQDIQKLPYLLKRLYSLGIQEGIHIISLIIAYEYVKKYVPGHIPTVGNVHSRPIYKLTPSGDIFKVNGEYVQVHYSGKYYLWAFPWISGLKTNKNKIADINRDNELFMDAKELVYICNKYGVDLADEDPSLYTKEYIDNLVVSYVTTSREYILGKRRSIIPKYIWDSVRIEDYNKPIELPKKSESTHQQIVDKYKLMFNLTTNSDVVNKLRNSTVDMNEIETVVTCMCYIMNRPVLNVRELITIDGFLYTSKGSIVEFPCRFLTKRQDVATTDTFLVNTLGYLVRVADNGKDVIRIMNTYRASVFLKTFIKVATTRRVPFTEMYRHYIDIIDNMPDIDTPYGTWEVLHENSIEY